MEIHCFPFYELCSSVILSSFIDYCSLQYYTVLYSSRSLIARWLELDVGLYVRLGILVLAPHVLAFLLFEYCPPDSRYSYSERFPLEARVCRRTRYQPI